MVVARAKKQASVYMVAKDDMIALTEVVNSLSIWLKEDRKLFKKLWSL